MAATVNHQERIGGYTVDSYRVIGTGAYGVVTTGSDSSGKKIAAKRIAGEDKRKMKKISADLDRLKTLDHTNIVKIFDINRLESTIWIFMEYCEFGDLNKFYGKSHPRFKDKIRIMLHIARGVEYLHSENVIHRDIKPANILISNIDPIVVKLTDFDCSKFLEPDYDTSRMSTNVGTPAFKAPEFFRQFKDGGKIRITYHRNVDIYSTGLTFLALIQENKMLKPRIETPNEPSEIHQCVGQLIAERIKFKKKPLEIIRSGDSSLVSKLFGKKKVDSGDDELRKLIRKMTRPEPIERVDAGAVVQRLNEILSKFSREQSATETDHHVEEVIKKMTLVDPKERLSGSEFAHNQSIASADTSLLSLGETRIKTPELDVKLLVTRDTELVAWGRTRFTVMEREHIIMWGKSSEQSPPALHIFHSSSAGLRKVREVEPLCEHHEDGVYLHPVRVKNEQLLAVSCWLCQKIRLYNMESEEVTVAFHYPQYYPVAMSTGEGIMYVVHHVEGDTRVLELNTEQIPFTGPSAEIQSGTERYHSMIHIPAPHQLIVFSGNYEPTFIRAVSCVTGEKSWELRGEIDGKMCCPCGLFFSQDHQVLLVADGTNCRVLVLHPGNGSLIQAIQLDPPMDPIVELHIHQQLLIVLHNDGEKEKASYFSIN